MRSFAITVVSLVAGCAPYTYDANGNPVPVHDSVAYYGTLSTSNTCGRPDHPKPCQGKWHPPPCQRLTEPLRHKATNRSQALLPTDLTWIKRPGLAGR